jgi:membrane protein DedA with SNARE-associated domain
VFDWLTEAVSNGPVGYLVVLLASGGDVLFPPVPSESIVVTAGVLAAQGDMQIALIVPLAAIGALIGDNVSYLLGRRVGEPVADRLFRGDKGRERLEWAERAVRRHGGVLVVIGRFIPGGRTASTFAAGTLEMPWRRFIAADLVAVVLWATFASMLGYAGGSTFKDSTGLSLLASLGVAALIGVAIEVWRRVQRQRGRDILGDPLDRVPESHGR